MAITGEEIQKLLNETMLRLNKGSLTDKNMVPEITVKQVSLTAKSGSKRKNHDTSSEPVSKRQRTDPDSSFAAPSPSNSNYFSNNFSYTNSIDRRLTHKEIEKFVSEDRLDLDDLSLTSENVEEICTFLNKHPNIKVLDISGNYLGDEGAKKLANIRTLRSIDFSNNLISADGIIELSKITTFRFIDISNNAIYENMDNDQALAALNRLNKMPRPLINPNNLKRYVVNHTLDLSKIPLVSINPEAITSFLNNHPEITKLDLSNRVISKEMMLALAANKTLTSLAMKNCNIDDNLAAILVKNKTLILLDMYDNKISEDMATYLVMNLNLRHFDFRRNKIDDSAIIALIIKKILGSSLLDNNTIAAQLSQFLSTHAVVLFPQETKQIVRVYKRSFLDKAFAEQHSENPFASEPLSSNLNSFFSSSSRHTNSSNADLNEPLRYGSKRTNPDTSSSSSAPSSSDSNYSSSNYSFSSSTTGMAKYG